MVKKRIARRPRGSQLPPPTQDHLHVRAVVPPGFVISDDGTIAAAVEVSPVDLSLAGGSEIAARQEQFASFVAGLQHTTPIQVVIATVPQRCQEYRDRVAARVERFRELAEQARRTGDEAARRRREHMAEVAEAHLSLFEVLLEEIRPKEERYLVVVWRNPFPLVGKRRELSADRLEEGKREVERRLAMVAGQLEHIGLETRRASADDLVQILYSFYHMTTSPLARATRPAILAGAIAFAPPRAQDGDGDESRATQ
ncbi:MAG TPA: hypothetical protein ENI39_04665 [Anaerolineae bacterium]|nr:hypothetical protein [Anaerolineae bacterium]